jgi:hypothetical protein
MAKVIVYHRFYGCDTGCCGHVVEVFDDDVVASEDFDPYMEGDGRNFEFDHPYFRDATDASRRAWAQEFVREHLGEEHVKDLDWEHCIISDD